MRTAAFLLLAVGTCLGSLQDGGGNDESVTFRSKISREGPPKECLEELNLCLSRRLCHSRVNDLEVSCCKSSFVEKVFNYTMESDCFDEKISPDVEDCLMDMDSVCLRDIIKFLEGKDEKFEAIENELRKAVPEPKNKHHCGKYVTDMEEEEWRRCKENTDEDIAWLCDLLQMIMGDSPKEKRMCLENFGECVVSSVSEAMVRNTSISCCKQSIKDKTHYFDENKKCAKEKFGPVFHDCLKSVSPTCLSEIIQRFFEDKAAIEKFNKKVEEEIGVPLNVMQCGSHYRDGLNLVLRKCKHNVDERLELFCDLTQRIFQHYTEKEEKYMY